jgi:cobalt-zinc-cadmium efflux system protein
MSTRGRIVLALVLAAGVAALEFWGGLASRSLALTTDALHVCMDVFALAIALVSSIVASRRANRRKTFGYGRVEVLGALFNSALLFGATLVVIYAAFRRFGTPVEPHGATMTIVAAIGLVANGAIGLTLAHDHSHNLNVRAALFHVIGDALGALAVIIGGILILITHQAWIDPLFSLVVAAIILVGVARVLRDASDVLLEGTPPGVDSEDVEHSIREIAGISDVHDLHVWTIGSSSGALTAHVLIEEPRLQEGAAILSRLRTMVAQRYGIEHVTVQLESEHCDPGGIIICRPES